MQLKAIALVRVGVLLAVVEVCLRHCIHLYLATGRCHAT